MRPTWKKWLRVSPLLLTGMACQPASSEGEVEAKNLVAGRDPFQHLARYASDQECMFRREGDARFDRMLVLFAGAPEKYHSCFWGRSVHFVIREATRDDEEYAVEQWLGLSEWSPTCSAEVRYQADRGALSLDETAMQRAEGRCQATEPTTLSVAVELTIDREGRIPKGLPPRFLDPQQGALGALLDLRERLEALLAEHDMLASGGLRMMQLEELLRSDDQSGLQEIAAAACDEASIAESGGAQGRLASDCFMQALRQQASTSQARQ